MEGDEERLSAAITEAAKAAVDAIADLMTPDAVRDRLRDLAAPASVSTPEARHPRPDDDDVVPVIWDRD